MDFVCHPFYSANRPRTICFNGKYRSTAVAPFFVMGMHTAGWARLRLVVFLDIPPDLLAACLYTKVNNHGLDDEILENGYRSRNSIRKIGQVYGVLIYDDGDWRLG